MTSLSSPPTSWHVSGSYFEACNCDAICPCRRVGDRPGGRSTHGICQFALSWHIDKGRADDVTLSDLDVVLAGWYDDDEPGSPWRISLYIGDDANDAQYASLASIFLGRAGGTALENFAAAIGTVHQVRRARIRLSHVPRRWFIRAATFVSVSAKVPVEASAPVACGIPGLDRPGPGGDRRRAAGERPAAPLGSARALRLRHGFRLSGRVPSRQAKHRLQVYGTVKGALWLLTPTVSDIPRARYIPGAAFVEGPQP